MADKRLKEALAAVSSSLEGKYFLLWLMSACGHQKPSFDVVPGIPIEHSTTYNEARRILWLQIREYLPEEVLYEIEIKHLSHKQINKDN